MGDAGQSEELGESFAPRVSVVMPVRDRAHCVARAIDGVLGQTYRDFELIVVDDGSSDGTADIAAGYGDALTLIRQPAAGAYQARNRGIAAAKGELIAFADSDDVWLPGKLEAQVPLLYRPEVALVFGDTVIEGEMGGLPGRPRRPASRRRRRAAAKRRRRWHGATSCRPAPCWFAARASMRSVAS